MPNKMAVAGWDWIEDGSHGHQSKGWRTRTIGNEVGVLPTPLSGVGLLHDHEIVDAALAVEPCFLVVARMLGFGVSLKFFCIPKAKATTKEDMP